MSRVLRPLVRAMIRSGITFPVLADALRALFVEVAQGELGADGRRVSDSRVSLLTGIHRKELRRQRTTAPAAEPEVVTLHTRLIARWLADPALTDADGAPRPLSRAGFDGLVSGITKDVHPRAVLDDLRAGGLVRLEGDAAVLLARAFVPTQSVEARLFFFGRNLHDHAAAAVANIGAAQPPFLDRSVHYDRLSPAAAAALEQAARRAAEQTLLDVNRAALGIADGDVPTGPTRRVNMGVFVYAEDEADAP